jgi:hypothetical protein
MPLVVAATIVASQVILLACVPLVRLVWALPQPHVVDVAASVAAMVDTVLLPPTVLPPATSVVGQTTTLVTARPRP